MLIYMSNLRAMWPFSLYVRFCALCLSFMFMFMVCFLFYKCDISLLEIVILGFCETELLCIACVFLNCFHIIYRLSYHPYHHPKSHWVISYHSDVMMSATASQITGVSIVCSTICSGADQTKHQSSASLAFVREIHQWPVNSQHKGPAMRKMFPFNDVSTIWL